MSKSRVKLLEVDGKTWSYCYSKKSSCKKHNHPASLQIINLFNTPTLEKIQGKVIIDDSSEIITYSNYLMLAERQSKNEAFNCKDCGINTLYSEEYYMVKDSIWKTYGVNRGMLCIGCLETRLGRTLTANDFSDVPINQPFINGKSERLLRRLFNK
jgi:hypothetical protein